MVDFGDLVGATIDLLGTIGDVIDYFSGKEDDGERGDGSGGPQPVDPFHHIRTEESR